MDGLIGEAKNKGGIPSAILFEPQEAADFLKEIRDLQIQSQKHIRVEYNKTNAIDMRFILQAPLTKKRLQDLIEQWYKRDFIIYYKDVELRVIKKKAVAVPVASPPAKIIKEGSIGRCEQCGSSLHKKYIFWNDGCLQPECENYYQNNS